MMRIAGVVALLLMLNCPALAEIDQGQTGAWYTYAWVDGFENSRFGWQGDIQHRNWDSGGDIEQLLVRMGGTWTPENSNIRYTLGAAWINSEDFGPSREDNEEKRIYQEAFIPQKVGDRLFFTHRWRLEQRWLEQQNQRNRIRYFLGLNYPLNQATLGEGAFYLSFYNELFVNLERNLGDDRRVDYFDRNRFYAAIGYSLSDRTRLQFGFMHQETRNIGKGQLQVNLFQFF